MLSRRDLVKWLGALGVTLPIFSTTSTAEADHDPEVTVWFDNDAKLLTGEYVSKISSETVFIDETNVIIEFDRGHELTVPRDNIARIEGDVESTHESIDDLPW